MRVRREGADAALCVADDGAGMPPELLGGVFEGFVQGDRVLRLTIEDHGTVIGVQDLSRVFEPFVTIEGRGQGSGLALAISHNIVRESGGALGVETERELTRFHLDLPLAAEH
mgnify:CR=1 FL=1